MNCRNNVLYANIFLEMVFFIFQPASCLRFSWNEFERLTQDYANHSDVIEAFSDYSKQHLKGFFSLDIVGFGRSANGMSIPHMILRNGNRNDKPTIVIEAGIHGAERVTAGAVFKLFDQLQKHQDSHEGVEHYNWLLIPSLNIDGYLYHQRQEEKKGRAKKKPRKKRPQRPPPEEKDIEVYRKNVNDFKKNLDVIKPIDANMKYELPTEECIGVDLNLNFDYQWGIGGSGNSCSNDYYGKSAHSEPETRSLLIGMDNVHQLVGKTYIYISLHSNKTRRVMIPFSDGNVAKDYDEQESIALAAVKKISVLYPDKPYKVGNIGALKGASSGHSVDYMKSKMGIKYVYMIDLPDLQNYKKKDKATYTIDAAESVDLIFALVNNIKVPSGSFSVKAASNSPPMQNTHFSPLFIFIYTIIQIFLICFIK